MGWLLVLLMALSVKTGSFAVAAADTVGTTIDVTCGFQPKAIIFWCNGRADAVDAVGSASHRRAYGFGVSNTDRRTIATASEVGAAAADADCFHSDARCLLVSTSDGTEEGGLDLSAVGSWPADGFQVVVDDQFATNLRVAFLALGGTDITNVATGNVSIPNTGSPPASFDVTAPGFQPDLAFFFGGVLTIAAHGLPGGRSDGATISFGAAVSSSQQVVMSQATDEASATMDTGSYGIGGECLAIMNRQTPVGGLDEEVVFTQFLSTGFRATTTPAVSAYVLHYLVIKGVLAAVGEGLTRTDGADIVVSGLSFPPAAVLVLSHAHTESTADLGQAGDEWSFGAATSVTERVALGLHDEDGTANAEIATAIEYDEIYINLNAASAVEGLMDVKSFDAGGVTFVMDDTDPSANWFGYVAIGPLPLPPSLRPTIVLDAMHRSASW